MKIKAGSTLLASAAFVVGFSMFVNPVSAATNCVLFKDKFNGSTSYDYELGNTGQPKPRVVNNSYVIKAKPNTVQPDIFSTTRVFGPAMVDEDYDVSVLLQKLTFNNQSENPKSGANAGLSLINPTLFRASMTASLDTNNTYIIVFTAESLGGTSLTQSIGLNTLTKVKLGIEASNTDLTVRGYYIVNGEKHYFQTIKTEEVLLNGSYVVMSAGYLNATVESKPVVKATFDNLKVKKLNCE